MKDSISICQSICQNFPIKIFGVPEVKNVTFFRGFLAEKFVLLILSNKVLSVFFIIIICMFIKYYFLKCVGLRQLIYKT